MLADSPLEVPMQALFITVIIAAAVAAIVASYFAARRRDEALARVARELNLHFDSSRDRTRVLRRFNHIDLLNKGSNRYTEDHLAGQVDGYPVLACDLHYETGSGKNRTHHRYGLILLTVPLRLSEVIIRREGLFDRLAAAVGFEDIDFESAEFSGRFHVSATDRRFAYDLIHARAIEYLMRQPDYNWEFEGDTIALYHTDRFEPEEIGPAIRFAIGFVDLIPEYVWEQRGQPRKGTAHAT